LRSLRSGQPIPIKERHRFGAQHPPHVVIDLDAPPPTVYQNDVWTRQISALAIYDDTFVDENVYSGLSVESAHRQNLNELILGSQGIALNTAVQAHVEAIEVHNRALREKGEALPDSLRNGLSVEAFCALQERSDVEEALNEARRNLAAVQQSASILEMALLQATSIDPIPLGRIEELLGRSLASLDSAALAEVGRCLGALGPGSESWVADGVGRDIHLNAALGTADLCPFCMQSTKEIGIVHSYRAYFSTEYDALKREVAETRRSFRESHGTGVVQQFDRVMEQNRERSLFWKAFTSLPEFDLDPNDLSSKRRVAEKSLDGLLSDKEKAPLDALRIPDETKRNVEAFEEARIRVDSVNQAVAEGNRAIALVKERAAGGNAAALASDIRRLTMLKERFTPEVQAACEAYMQESDLKQQAEENRGRARAALDTYRASIFPAYETAINVYLQRLNAGFRVGSVVSTNTRGGGSCTYSVVVNNQPVPTSGTAAVGEPSFRNVLSAGDRNTLALAFFFASLDRDPSIATRIVVIDDPMTSLDEHRRLATSQEIRRLSRVAAQVIVLSHDKPFLSGIWVSADRTERSSLQIVRDGTGSTLRPWDVNSDLVTEHDKRHALLRAYLDTNTGDSREVASALRNILEAYLRVAYPEHCPPGTLLGQFIGKCRLALTQNDPILNVASVDELDHLREYANRFHHDANSAFETEPINDAELLGFVRRVITFTRNP